MTNLITKEDWIKFNEEQDRADKSVSDRMMLWYAENETHSEKFSYLFWETRRDWEKVELEKKYGVMERTFENCLNWKLKTN